MVHRQLFHNRRFHRAIGLQRISVLEKNIWFKFKIRTEECAQRSGQAFPKASVKRNSGHHAKTQVSWRLGLCLQITIEYSNQHGPKSEKESLAPLPQPELPGKEGGFCMEMAQMQSRKRKSTVLDDEDRDQPSSTPTGSPARKRTKITQAQKQALIDNLQLESKPSHCLQRGPVLIP
jgi:hypothetical protein